MKKNSDLEFQASFSLACCCFILLPSLIGLSIYYSKEIIFPALTVLVSVIAPLLGLPVILNRILKNPKPTYIVVGVFLIGLFNSYSIIVSNITAGEGSLYNLIKELLIPWGILTSIYIVTDRAKLGGKSAFIASHSFLGGINLLVIINLVGYFVLGLRSEYVTSFQESLVLSSFFGSFFERAQFPFFSGLNSLGILGAILFGGGVGMAISGNTLFKYRSLSYVGRFNTYASILLGLVCIFLSDTRSAYALMILTPILLWVLRSLSATSSRMFSVIVFFVLPLITPLVLLSIDITGSNFNRGEGEITSGRNIIWAESITIIQSSNLEQWIFGRGPTLLQESNIVKALFSSWTTSIVTSHNTFLNHLYTLGIVGALFWIILIYFISLQMGRLAKSTRYGYCAPILFTIILISSVESFNTPTNMLIHYPFLWSLFTLISVASEENLENEEEEEDSKDRLILEGMVSRLSGR